MTPLHHLLNKSDLPSSGTAEPSGPGFPKLTPGAPHFFRESGHPCPSCGTENARNAIRFSGGHKFIVTHCRSVDCGLSRHVVGRLDAQEREGV